MDRYERQYEEETGLKATYRMRSSDYHNLAFVDWLKRRIEKLVKENNQHDAIWDKMIVLIDR